MAATSQPPPASYQPQQAQAQQIPTQRRKSRAFSFRSDKSHGSGSHKADLHETHEEKEAKRLHSKADPTLAIQEAEPAAVAAMVKSSLASLRSIQHKDVYGNLIVDPDRSNPTRSRWERPLDTIRSFEAAIDGGYSSRRSMVRPDTEGGAWGPSRRTSYYGTNGAGGRFAHDSYYGSRPPSTMYANRSNSSQQELRLGAMGQRDSYYDPQTGYSASGAPAQSGRRGWPRMPSEPQYGSASRQQNGQEYSIPSNQRSYETVTTASGSGSSGEPPGYLTDPTSSDNSSVERMQSAPKPQQEPVNDYGIGFGQSPSFQPPALSLGASMNGGNVSDYQASGALSYGGGDGGGAPPLPRKDPGPVLKKAVTSDHVQQRPAQPEKRKSWFARRFSKQG